MGTSKEETEFFLSYYSGDSSHALQWINELQSGAHQDETTLDSKKNDLKNNNDVCAALDDGQITNLKPE